MLGQQTSAIAAGELLGRDRVSGLVVAAIGGGLFGPLGPSCLVVTAIAAGGAARPRDVIAP